MPANLIWGAGLLLLLYLAGGALVAVVVVLPLLALPTVGLFRMAALIARGDAVALSDALSAWRSHGAPALIAGFVFTVMTVVFLVNVTLGIASGSVFGAVLAAFAGWGLVVLWTGALAFWPLLVDPRRAELRLRDHARLAALLVLAFPLRLGVLLFVVAVILAVSTVLFAALLTVSVAFVVLLGSRYVLAIADRFEGRATELVLE